MEHPDASLNISAVERETGLSKDVLRIWERRYGFPRPGRDDNAERQYAAGDVAKLRAIKRLMDTGLRPGKLFRQSLEERLRVSCRADLDANYARTVSNRSLRVRRARRHLDRLALA